VSDHRTPSGHEDVIARSLDDFSRRLNWAFFFWILPLLGILAYWMAALAVSFTILLLAAPVDADVGWLDSSLQLIADTHWVVAMGEMLASQSAWVVSALVATMIALYAAGISARGQNEAVQSQLTAVGMLVAGAASLWAWGATGIGIDNMGEANGFFFDAILAADPQRTGLVLAGLVISFIVMVLALELSALTQTQASRHRSAIRRVSRLSERKRDLDDWRVNSGHSSLVKAIGQAVAAALVVPVTVTLVQVAVYAAMGFDRPWEVLTLNVPMMLAWVGTSVLVAMDPPKILRWFAWAFFFLQLVNVALAASVPFRGVLQDRPAAGMKLGYGILVLTWLIWGIGVVLMSAPGWTRRLQREDESGQRGRGVFVRFVHSTWRWTLVSSIRRIRYNFLLGALMRAEREEESLRPAPEPPWWRRFLAVK
jgi:hypothetical protein